MGTATIVEGGMRAWGLGELRIAPQPLRMMVDEVHATAVHANEIHATDVLAEKVHAGEVHADVFVGRLIPPKDPRPRPALKPRTGRPPPIYTRRGDGGETGLLREGCRVPKDDPAFGLIGRVDALQSWLGTLQDEHAMVAHVQRALIDLNSRLAARASGHDIGPVWAPRGCTTADLEASMDDLSGAMPRLRHFILSNPASASAHVARTLARGVERRYHKVMKARFGGVFPAAEGEWLNRLSDWLFVLARVMTYWADRREDTHQTAQATLKAPAAAAAAPAAPTAKPSGGGGG